MGWKERLLDILDKILKLISTFKKKMLDQMQRGREVTQQQKAERMRKKSNKYQDMKPGARKAIHDGLVMKQTPWEVMKAENSRRKYEREKKYGKK